VAGGGTHAARTHVTDKRGRASTAPGGQRRGVGVNVNERVGAALTSGAGSIVRPIRFSIRIKLISNKFKFVPKFDRSKSCLPLLQKFQIKYGWKELEIRNNYSYRIFPRFGKESELKFRELL
jgi:hypothetical protein